jgi:hypothetical protein
LRSVEKLLLDLMGYWQSEDHPIRAIERAGLNRRQLRRQALDIIMRLPKICDDSEERRNAWVVSAQTEVEHLGLVLPQGQTVARYFRRPPPSSRWSQHLQAPLVTSLVSSTIHEAKGKEYEAVCVVLQPDRAPGNRTFQLFRTWENRIDDEAKRVIYVGITRAKKLVMLVVPETFSDRCVAILVAGGVPFERVETVERIVETQVRSSMVAAPTQARGVK